MYGCGLFAEFYKPSKPQMHLSEIRMGYSKKKFSTVKLIQSLQNYLYMINYLTIAFNSIFQS